MTNKEVTLKYEPQAMIFNRKDSAFVLRKDESKTTSSRWQAFIILYKSHPLYKDSYKDYSINKKIEYDSGLAEHLNLGLGYRNEIFLDFDGRILGFSCCKSMLDGSNVCDHEGIDFAFEQLEKLEKQMEERTAKLKSGEEDNNDEDDEMSFLSNLLKKMGGIEFKIMSKHKDFADFAKDYLKKLNEDKHD